ncbi:MAG: (2Fe-2S)-binding protein [Ectothiorhodospiraceae bacterium]|nr:(2Fe-2S)-binding protein [Ectothiorhodospiraceae bacterium]MCH8503796.1 (2Fe-2S)-binding protein [Ectothiorhodospiraceae bacterium]
MSRQVELTINGKAVSVPVGTTLWDAAAAIGIDIPVLCHEPRLRPVGVCRLCVVDVGARTLAAACVRPCEEGMEVRTDSEEVEAHRRTLLELLLADQPDESARENTTGDDALYELARRYGIKDIPLPDGAAGHPRGRDDSSPVIAVDHQACILCDRCIRGCDEIQHNNVITRTGKGYETRIAFDLDTAMGESTCVACGECVAVCPTGALTHKAVHGLRLEEET